MSDLHRLTQDVRKALQVAMDVRWCLCGHAESDHVTYDHPPSGDCRNGGKWTCECPAFEARR